MGLWEHSVHIARHIEQLAKARDEQKIAELLRVAGLRLNGASVETLHGGAVTDDTCIAYVAAVESMFGSAVCSFAKVNFVLAGCTCHTT
jgi:hypothetical protein